MQRTIRLVVLPAVMTLLVLLIGPAGAHEAPDGPQTSPCAPGAAYDPACDVDHDNDVDIFDIQLAAGHWNRAGTWTGGDFWALADLPITSWSHRTEDPTISHIGPTGEDFYVAFGLGSNDGTAISTVDADGVALATIQALYQLILEQQAQLADQQQRIEALETRWAVIDVER